MMEQKQAFQGRVLIVDDDATIRQLLTSYLDNAGFQVDAVSTLGELKAKVQQRTYDALLLDLFLENEDGLTALPFMIQHSPYTKVIIMTAHGTVELAVNAMEQGASSFISKSKNPEDIVMELQRRLAARDQANATDAVVNQYGIIGQSPETRHMLEMIEQVKDVDSTVLIVGESGTGKELVARAIHQASARRTNRFEALNCGAIPGNLLESELFGHRRGAFTDAKTDRKGIFEACSNGTLLLDEIGEMPLELQVKLLRVLQERQVTPLGSSQSLAVNTRVIAATNKDLSELVRRGEFREDLYFRLAVVTIKVPSLRERREDIPQLLGHFIEKMNSRFNKKVAYPSREVEARLMAYDWPGNIREFQNAVERAVVLSSNNELRLEHLLDSKPLRQGAESNEVAVGSDQLIGKTLSEAKRDFERTYLQQLLEITRGNISEIARISGRYRADVYRLLSKHGVEWEEFRP